MTRVRFIMVGLSMGVRLVNFVQRLGLPSLIPFIVTEYGFSEGQRAVLLGGFFPGYCLTMIPAGIISTRVGYKSLLSINLAGNALVLLATPVAASLSTSLGVAPLFCCFTVMGLLQGPLVPAMAVCHRNWMPAGPERAWGLRIYSLGGRVGTVITRLSIPFFSTRFGWRSVAWIYGAVSGAFALVWHVWAANSANDWRGMPRMNTAERRFLGVVDQPKVAPTPEGHSPVALKKARLPWFLFRSPAALIVCICHVASNSVGYSLDIWSPIYFTEVLGCDPLDVGKLLAIPSTVSLISTFLSGALDSALTARGVSLINIRRCMETTACVMKSAAIAAFACCKNPRYATLWICVIELFSTCHNSGHTASYLEVGGDNCGLLKSVGNTFANLPGYFVPLLGLFFKQHTGSYSPLFFLVSAFQLGAGVAYAKLVSVDKIEDTTAKTD